MDVDEDAPAPPPPPPAEGGASQSAGAAASSSGSGARAKRYTLLPGEYVLKLVGEQTSKTHSGWKEGDKVEAPWTDGDHYPGRIAEVHDDDTFTVHFDDGDVRRMSAEGFIPKFEDQGPFKALDGTVVKCSETTSATYPLSSLFDYQHGVPDGPKGEWRVKVPKGAEKQKDPKRELKLTIRFANNYYVSRMHVYSRMPDQAQTQTDYSIDAIPVETARSKLAQKPINVTDLVDTANDDNGRREFKVGRFVQAIIISMPFSTTAKKWMGLGAIDFFCKYPQNSPGQETTFHEDIGSLLRTPTFADCRVVCGTGGSKRSIACHRSILAARSVFFKKVLVNATLSRSPIVKSRAKKSRTRPKDSEPSGRTKKRLKMSSGADNDEGTDVKATGAASSSSAAEAGGKGSLSPSPSPTAWSSSEFKGWQADKKLSSNTQEVQQLLPVSSRVQEIDMPDLSYTTMMAVLTFLYTDKLIIQSVDEAVELWCTSEKYQFLRLGAQVEKYLEENLTVEKAIDICRSLKTLPLLGSLKETMIFYLSEHMDTAMVQKEFVLIPKDILHEIFCQKQAQKQIATKLSG